MISWRKHYKRVLLACSLLLTTSASIYAQDLKGDAKKGETLFKTNCSACHALDKQMVGPSFRRRSRQIKNGTKFRCRLVPKMD